MFDSKVTAEDAQRASTPAPVGTRQRWWLAGLAVVAAAAVGVVLYQRAHAPPPPAPAAAAPTPALTVSIAVARTAPVRTMVMGDGSVVAWQELIIGAEAGGLRLVEAPVEEGQSVKAGQLLARMEDSVLTAQLDQARAAISEAEAALQAARADLARSEQLVQSQSASRQTLDQRRSAAQQAEARLASARAAAEAAQARLDQARILAPTDGIVSKVSARIGSVTAVGQELFRILRDGRLELDARVPELDLAQVHPGQPVTVRHGDRMIPAEVREIAPVVAADTRLGIVHIALPPSSGLRPGMFASAEIQGPERQMVLVPEAAVIFRDGAPASFVLAEGTGRVQLRRLNAGARRDGMVEITEGLRAGEAVVVAGAGFLSDGDLVQAAR
ncbi:RND family efflux transporter MFP subunit [Humitalea rosea]|uniref:RND family efflux transporter MFP subunit n=1 Tax=Humitalea rosea TaxID=990373 RepID=A0A2W7IUJ4_9PROT|nr:efflux RND transporter periplasmic adaptor subunit [Humitalea rosea]PZW43147.1 RND family efflux transporter MFP subunit [Humitalea rosea]